MEVSEQVTLTRLPKNPQGPPNVSFGPVWGWRNGAKRRRHEICAAAEGNCVNVYEAQSGQILFAHAVPPTSIFSGPPCSLRWKEDGVIHRTTCYVTSDAGLALHVVSTLGNDNARPASVELKASISPVVHLDIVRNDTSVSVIVVQQDGTITTASSDLTNIITSIASLREPDGVDIMAATLMSVTHARKSVLRARSDLLNNLSADAQLVIAVSDSPDASTLQKNVTYAAWAIQPFEQHLVSSKVDIRPLLQHSLSNIAPILDAKSSDIIYAKFDSKATTVDIALSNGLLRFDLAGTVPRPYPFVGSIVEGSADMLALSTSHLMVADGKSIRVVDVNYSTIQSNTPRTLKRRKTASTNAQQLQFITFLSGINRIIAREGHTLIAINVGYGSTGRLPVSTLANNIGRGIEKTRRSPSSLAGMEVAIGGSPTFQPLPSGWKQNLQSLLEKNDLPAFEDILVQSSDLHSLEASQKNVQQVLPDEVVDFVLERMFKLEENIDQTDNAERLKLRFSSTKLVNILGRIGALRATKLQHILQLKAGSRNVLVPHDAILKALFVADSSLGLAQLYASAFTSPDAKETACVLQFLVQQVQTHSSESVQQPSLPAMNSVDSMEIESAPTNGHKRGPISAELESCLVPIMEHLGTFSMATISLSLKAVLAKHEVYTLIGLLRLQLFNAGHTGSIPLGDHKPDESSRVSLQSAVAILSACVDAFGPLDMVSQAPTDEMVESFVPQLLSEIAMVTQYIDESANLQGIIRETLRYAETQKAAISERKAITGGTGQPRRRGEIVTLYAQRTEDEDINGLPGALPLSLRADEAVKATKIRRGGGQIKQRSQREILMLQNRQKGPYTFERLIL